MPSIMYGIHRTEKFKKQDITGIQKEATRTADHYNNDVDITKSQYNVSLINYDNWNDRINEIVSYTGVKTRKDSIVMIGGLYAATGEFFLRHDNESKQEWQKRVLGYFRDCLDWHVKTYCQGNKDLMLSAEIHADEQNLHMQVYSVPIVDRGNGKYALSAKSIMGNRKAYVDRVDNFYNDVSKKYGLARGERTPEGQVAKKHIETQKYKLLKMQQELTETKAELTSIEQDKIIADFDRQELEQNIRIIKSKNQKLHQEYKNLQQQMQQIKTEISSLKSDKEIYSFDKQALLMENKKLRETKHGLQSQIEKLQSESKELKQQIEQQITRMEEKIKDKKETYDFLEKAVSERQDCCASLNSKIDDLGEIYENQFEEIDRALQIVNILQQEEPIYYDELQKRIDIPTTNISEFNYDDEEIEL